MRDLPQVVILTPRRVYPTASPPAAAAAAAATGRTDALHDCNREPRVECECRQPEEVKEEKEAACNAAQENDAAAGGVKRRLSLGAADPEEAATQKRTHHDNENVAVGAAPGIDHPKMRARKTRL